MKYLHHFLILVAASLLLQACKSDNLEDVLAPVSSADCHEMLDGWEITSTNFPRSAPHDLVFLNDQVGYMAGNMGAILKSTDGGLTWAYQHGYYKDDLVFDDDALTNARLYTIEFVDEQLGFIGGEGEYATKSTTSDELAFHDTEAVLLKTTDGGTTWNKQYLPGVHAINDLRFVDEQTGIGSFSHYDADSNYVYRLYKTVDGGASWNEFDSGFGEKVIFGFVEAPSYLAAIVMDYDKNRTLWKSYDDGFTWQQVGPLPSFLNGIQYLTDELCFARDIHHLQKSTDGGQTWKVLDALDEYFYMFHFSSENEGFALGSVTDEPSGPGDDVIELIAYSAFQTKDGGKTWDKVLFDLSCDYLGPKYLVKNNSFYTLGNAGLNKFEMN
jgi:BNR/Asp-box repeat